ncbi:hypothetical protein Ga0100230_011280 [Opitutaceae bacterium TAV3]|nr:hypothetical protein Ga0100230_011280 [Opitutaceae bacterium TAV3]
MAVYGNQGTGGGGGGGGGGKAGGGGGGWGGERSGEKRGVEVSFVKGSAELEGDFVDVAAETAAGLLLVRSGAGCPDGEELGVLVVEFHGSARGRAAEEEFDFIGTGRSQPDAEARTAFAEFLFLSGFLAADEHVEA